MAQLDAEEQQRTILETLLSELNQFDVDSLVRKELGAHLNFEQFAPVFSRTLGLFKDLSECNLDNVPLQRLNQLGQRATQARSDFLKILEFSLEKYPSNPMDVRNNLGNAVANTYAEYFDTVSPVIAYSVRKGTDFSRLEKQAKETVEKLNTTVEENRVHLQDRLSDVESIIEKVRRAAQDVGVAQHNLLFSEEAREHRSAAETWLKVTAWLGGITLLASLLLFGVYLWSDKADKLQLPNVITVKIIIFGILISATLWAGRIYRAHRHNYVVNKHRANALTTFETFVKGTSENQTKDAVLLQSTHCIFSSQPSGYITQENDGGMYKQILEIVRGDRQR